MFGISKKTILSLLLMTPVFSAPVLADPGVTKVAQSTLPDLGTLEKRYFGRVYEKDATDKRIQRLELLLFGATQDGGMVERLDRLSQFASERAKLPKTAQSQGSDNASIGVLEKKILKKTFDAEPAAQRLSRLEAKVFGAASPSMSVSDRVFRLKKILNVETPSISRVPSFQRPNQMDPLSPFGGNFTMIPFSPGRNDDLAQQMNEMMRQMNKSLRGLHKLPDGGSPEFTPFMTPNMPPSMSPFTGPNSPFSEPFLPVKPPKKQDTELPPYLDPNSI